MPHALSAPTFKVTGAARLHRAASALTAELDLDWRLSSLELNLETTIDREVLQHADSGLTLSRQAQAR